MLIYGMMLMYGTMLMYGNLLNGHAKHSQVNSPIEHACAQQGLFTIESAEASIQQVALCAVLQQVVVHLRLGNVLVNLNSHWEAFQLCAVLSYLKAAFVGF